MSWTETDSCAAANLTADLTDFKLQITEMKRDRYTHNKILSKLQEQGVRVSLSTLKPSRESRAFLVVAVPKSGSATSLRNE